MTNRDGVSKRDILAKVTPLIDKVVTDLGLIPLEIDFIKESGRWFLRIFIYSSDHPISHEDCEAVSRKLNEYLDELIDVPYYLEISSPGLDRKLKSPKEYIIFKGNDVKIKLKQALEDGTKTFSAKLLDYAPQTGLKVKMLDSDKIINISESNINFIQLIY